ncbi:outer membrane protein assembly factor BamD [Gammaproteobacteria bacterium]|jgi:outer membrane protein assembly factor BamD|nr:outer membrane protein assembly factor BamD [Gammaproteobacteria bacterium]MDA9174011.1 outer membrane protein assembly factor BamD [Gammaproteobacteria bacterium]MDC1074201.1 outer membrane protein assembly factor BamD [Gammaproteobacteria bacterium]MDC3365511.1 outer membrane protein assembly factor BamD [Gammaproteobacteria bacterium]
MKHEKKFFFATYLIIVTSVLAGCSSDGPEIEQPEKVYYDLAQRRIESKNYIAAIESLQAIETRYPFGRYAEQAQVELIYVYFMNGENLAAHAAAEKFIRLHPRHPNIDYAYFMKGLSSYTRDTSILVRITDTDISNRDISGAKESFAELSEFLTRFPDSQYASYAKQRNIYLRNMIARNELSAADYYISIGAHVAAIRRAKYVIENIPNSSEGYRALKILEKSYKALGYQELYDDIKKIINLNYSQ